MILYQNGISIDSILIKYQYVGMNYENIKLENRQNSTGKRLKYKYLDKSLNHSLHKVYYSPERRQRSFVCARRNSIEDFSPYRNAEYEQGLVNKNIIEEIALQNQILNRDVIQYRVTVARLQEEVFQRDQKIIYIEGQASKDHSMYENIICEMKQQIRLILSKNVLLEGEVNRISDIRAKHRLLTESLKQEEFNLRNQLSDLIVGFELRAKRNNQSSSQKKRLLKSPIQIHSYLDALLRRNMTLEQFAKSISEMYYKIESQSSDDDLRSLWKWLKKMGQEYNYFKKLKKPLARKLCINADRPIQQIIDRALVQELKIII